MTTTVADASVVVKWLLPDAEGEEDVDRAIGLLRAVEKGRVKLHQPPHWLAEAAAVVARISPDTAEDDVSDLHELPRSIVRSRGVYRTACKLSVELSHHLFDTLYHAVALETAEAVLVTADERYYAKAHGRGAILRLAEFEPQD